MVTRVRAQAAPRVALAADDDRTALEVAQTAGARGIPVERLALEAAVAAPVGAVAWAPAAPPDAALAAKLAPLAAAAAERHRPLVVLAAFERTRGRAAEERAAALAFLRAHGALVLEDPDAWFEAATLLAVYGAPRGPRACVVAPPGGWMHYQAIALALEEEARGGRLAFAGEAADAPPADIALCDAQLAVAAPDRVGQAMVVPVAARAELLAGTGDRPALVGLRAALAAAQAAGRHAERLAAGLGPAPAADAKKLKVDRARVAKALAADRLGDQETKLLLSAYGAPVTRQAVASTPSAAVRVAQACGFPVEMRAWEADGGEWIGDLRNPPDVRGAFAAAATDAGFSVGVPVIVRVTPPAGRQVAARVERVAELGWTVFLDVPGAGRSLAAPAPLRRADADDLAAAVEASRAGDAPPDRAALAELLVRVSFAVVVEELDGLTLPRIVVAGRGEGAVVADASARLKKRR